MTMITQHHSPSVIRIAGAGTRRRNAKQNGSSYEDLRASGYASGYGHQIVRGASQLVKFVILREWHLDCGNACIRSCDAKIKKAVQCQMGWRSMNLIDAKLLIWEPGKYHANDWDNNLHEEQFLSSWLCTLWTNMIHNKFPSLQIITCIDIQTWNEIFILLLLNMINRDRDADAAVIVLLKAIKLSHTIAKSLAINTTQ